MFRRNAGSRKVGLPIRIILILAAVNTFAAVRPALADDGPKWQDSTCLYQDANGNPFEAPCCAACSFSCGCTIVPHG